METIIKPERKITPEINKEFESLFYSDASSSDLVDFADSYLFFPSFPNFALHQQIWIRDHRFFMGIDQQRQVSIDEAFSDYNQKLSHIHHEFYFLKYIQPVFCDAARNRDYLSWGQEERQWVEDEVDRVGKFVREESSLIAAIAKVSPILARNLEDEGFIAHCIPENELVLCGSSSDFSDFHSDYY